MMDYRLLDRVEQGIVKINNQQIIFANSAFLDRLGYPVLKGQPISKIMWEDMPLTLLEGQAIEGYFKSARNRKMPAIVEIMREKQDSYWLIVKEWQDRCRQQDLEAILDVMPYTIWIENMEGNYLYANQGIVEEVRLLLGKNVTKNELLRSSRKALWEGAFDTKTWQEDNRRLISEQIYNEDRSFEVKGNKVPYTLTKIPIKDPRGKVCAVICIKDNKLQRKQMEGKLLQGYNKYREWELRHLINPDCEEKIALIRPNHKGCFLGAETMVLCQYDEKQERLKVVSCVSDSDVVLTPTETERLDKATFYQHFLRPIVWWKRQCEQARLPFDIQGLFVEGANYVVQYPISYKGHLQGVMLAAYRQINDLNVVNKREIDSICNNLAIIIKNDKLLDELKKELQLREEAERKLKDFTEANIALYCIYDFVQEQVIVNQGWSKLLGWDNVAGMDPDKTIHPADRHEVNKKIQAAKEGEIQQAITRFNCEQGGYRWVRWRIKRTESQDRLILFGVDITSEVNNIEQRKAYQKALELETAKNEFLANMSHELKTPLNIIYTVMQLMEGDLETLQSQLPVDFKRGDIMKHKQMMKQNIYRLLRLIDNIVDISKIGAGYYPLNLQNCNIVAVVEEITLSVADYIKDKHLELIFDTEEEEIETACDVEKIERMMLNLLSNAVKYSKESGHILVMMKRKEGQVIIEVKDDGIGIPKEKQQQIFERFVQVDQTFTRKCEGSGIGLSLVKSLVEMQHGTIGVVSKLGEGSTFTVKLPIKWVVEEKTSKVARNMCTIHSRVEKCNIEFSDIYTVN